MQQRVPFVPFFNEMFTKILSFLTMTQISKTTFIVIMHKTTVVFLQDTATTDTAFCISIVKVHKKRILSKKRLLFVDRTN